jgi:hypothetical protein
MHHVAEGSGSGVDTLVNGIKALQRSALKPVLEILSDLGKRFKIVREHETFHARTLGDQFPTVIEAAAPLIRIAKWHRTERVSPARVV